MLHIQLAVGARSRSCASHGANEVSGGEHRAGIGVRGMSERSERIGWGGVWAVAVLCGSGKHQRLNRERAGGE